MTIKAIIMMGLEFDNAREAEYKAIGELYGTFDLKEPFTPAETDEILFVGNESISNGDKNFIIDCYTEVQEEKDLQTALRNKLVERNIMLLNYNILLAEKNNERG